MFRGISYFSRLAGIASRYLPVGETFRGRVNPRGLEGGTAPRSFEGGLRGSKWVNNA